MPMETPTTIRPEHWSIFLASWAIHLSYFYLIKRFVPYIGQDRKRLSWVLTLATAIIVSILGPLATYQSIRISSSLSWPSLTAGLSDAMPHYAHGLNHRLGKRYGWFDGKRDGDDVNSSLDTAAEVVAQFHSAPGTQSSSLREKDILAPFLSGPKWVHVAVDKEQRQSHHRHQDQDQGSQEPQARTNAEFEDGEATMTTMFSWLSTIREHQRRTPYYQETRWRSLVDLTEAPSETTFTEAMVIFFATYLLADMVCGFLHYRERVTLLTGWFHHAVYSAICYYTVVIAHESFSFTAFLVIEVPTVIIGLGHIDRRLRHDMLFGASFLVFRIIYDFSLTFELLMNRGHLSNIATIILLFKSTMNFKFFLDWINQQIRLRRRRQGEGAKDHKASTNANAPHCAEGSFLEAKVTSSTLGDSDRDHDDPKSRQGVISLTHPSKQSSSRKSTLETQLSTSAIKTSSSARKATMVHPPRSSSLSSSPLIRRGPRAVQTGGSNNTLPLLDDQPMLDLITVH